jgi:hypothetical protein
MHPSNPKAAIPTTKTDQTNPSNIPNPAKILIPTLTPAAAITLPVLGKHLLQLTLFPRTRYHRLINRILHMILTPRFTQLAQTSPSPANPTWRRRTQLTARKIIEKKIMARDCLARSLIVAILEMKDSVTPLMAMMGM